MNRPKLLADFLWNFISESAAFDVTDDGTLWDWDEDEGFLAFLDRWGIREEFKALSDRFGILRAQEQEYRDYMGRTKY